jgi:hypothetical protein
VWSAEDEQVWLFAVDLGAAAAELPLLLAKPTARSRLRSWSSASNMGHHGVQEGGDLPPAGWNGLRVRMERKLLGGLMSALALLLDRRVQKLRR